MPRDRRTFLKQALSTAAAFEIGQNASAQQQTQLLDRDQPPFRFIFETEWNDIVCADYPLTRERWIEECIRPLAGTQVDTILYNLCSSDAYVCGLNNGELIANNVQQFDNAWVWRYRENTKKIIEAGANPPKLAVEYGHRLGLKVIPIVRMNDPHDQYFKYEVSRFKRTHPELLIGYGRYPINWEAGVKGLPPNLKTGMDSHTWGMFDFAHKEVRDHKFAIIEELITRWDNDGISLDFDRDPRFFREFGKAENAALMTDLIRRIRKTLDSTARIRGRKLYFHVRVIPRIDVCYERGLDVVTWVNESLVDAITPGCGYMTVTQEIAPWKELVRLKKTCYVYACINHWRTTEETRAWAHLMYDRGADGVQLFNYGHSLFGFDRNTSPKSDRQGTVRYSELNPEYYRVLHELSDVRIFKYSNRRYVLESVPHEVLEGEAGKTFRQFRAIDAIRLPVPLRPGRHSVEFGIADDLKVAALDGVTASVTLNLKLKNYTTPDEFDVALNGKILPRETRTERAVFIMNDDTWITFPVPTDLVNHGKNNLEVIVRTLNPEMASAPVLTNLEICVNFEGELVPQTA